MKPFIKPLGVADLKVVKQSIARYEAGEVAHIENVLAREMRERTHRHLRQDEETSILEQERTEENVRDLQSTERFELSSESQKVIKSDTKFEAGLELSAGFGPVELSAFAKFATSSSSEESQKLAQKYAKDITERAASKVIERVREERRRRTLEETEETNKHGFEAGANNLTGVYRWVDKYYRCKVVNYGRRLMFEFYIPEPAAFHLFATLQHLASKVLPAKPEPPKKPGSSALLKPSDITRTNYLTLVHETGAEGVNPPPPDYLRVGKALHRETPTSDHFAFSNEDLKLPKGYKASSGGYAGNYTWQGDDPSCAIHVGLNRISMNTSPSLTFSGETNVVPIACNGYGLRTFSFNFTIWCKLLDEHYDKWKLDTYNAIMAAYQKSLMEYEEKVAAAQIRGGVAIGGENPGLNRETERQELRRSILTLWMREPVNVPSGIVHNASAPPPGNYPELNIINATANAPLLEFLDRAFDWRNMAYEFLPYFMGRRARWVDLCTLESTDPAFEQFLRAGAARVLVPVNLSHTEAVLYFQLTGIIPAGGPVPPLDGILDPDTELYNSYVDELADVQEIEDLTRDEPLDPDDEETWLMKLPTSLVWLQADGALPDFEA